MAAHSEPLQSDLLPVKITQPRRSQKITWLPTTAL